MPRKTADPNNIIVVLNNIRSVFNVGSIFRTADAAGVEKIYLVGITPSPLDRLGKPREKLAKVALGAEKYVKWEKTRSAVKLISRLKDKGYEIFAIEQSPKSIPYFKYMPLKNKKIALILGSETAGLPVAILNKADKILEIPMKGNKESLNVAVSFGIVVFDLINKGRISIK